MSKISLKKELVNLEKNQLIEVVLTAYNANKEIKEYFDFYLNPNPDALYDKYSLLLMKEFSKTKYGSRSKARISVIKKIIKKFESFKPGHECVIQLYEYVIKLFLITESRYYFTEVLFNGLKKISIDYLKYSNDNEIFDNAIEYLDNLTRDYSYTKPARNKIRESIEEFIEEKGIGLSNTKWRK